MLTADAPTLLPEEGSELIPRSVRKLGFLVAKQLHIQGPNLDVRPSSQEAAVETVTLLGWWVD